MDFTLKSYSDILDSALRAGVDIYPVVDWYQLPFADKSGIMLRHDVDRRPQNALAMAKAEALRGVRSSYYFRIVPSAFEPSIITEIAALGHEIGYHYEDWYLSGRNPEKAIRLFEANLDRLRQIAQVRSIAMHGSPLSAESNMKIWNYVDFKDYGVIDAILSFDYKEYVFFTDSGRTFGQTKSNLRDYLNNAIVEPLVRTSEDLARFVATSAGQKIQINVHPERWNEPGFAWYRQYAIDVAANAVKRIIKVLRKP